MSQNQAEYSAGNQSAQGKHYPFTDDEWAEVEMRVLSTGVLWGDESQKLIRMIRRMQAHIAGLENLVNALQESIADRRGERG